MGGMDNFGVGHGLGMVLAWGLAILILVLLAAWLFKSVKK